MAKKPFDLLFKIVLLGEPGVERFQILTRFTDDTYSDSYITAIGIDFKIKHVELNGKKIKLQIWSPSGGERFYTIIHTYYRGAAGFMFIYDITQEKTFDNIPKWLKNVQEHVDEDVEKMLLGNKCEMEEERKISRERGEEFAKENGLKFFETSAKENINVEKAFMTMLADILKKFPEGHPSLSGVVKPGTKKGDNSVSQRCF